MYLHNPDIVLFCLDIDQCCILCRRWILLMERFFHNHIESWYYFCSSDLKDIYQILCLMLSYIFWMYNILLDTNFCMLLGLKHQQHKSGLQHMIVLFHLCRNTLIGTYHTWHLILNCIACWYTDHLNMDLQCKGLELMFQKGKMILVCSLTWFHLHNKTQLDTWHKKHLKKNHIIYWCIDHLNMDWQCILWEQKHQ